MAPALQQRARRAMWSAALVLLASPIVGSILLDLCPPRARDPGTASTISRWHAHAEAPEILVLGSSRSGRCIDAHQATSHLRERTGDPAVELFNAAVPAGDPLLMERLSADLVKHGRAPRVVLIEVSADTIGRRSRLLEFAIANQFTAGDAIAHFGDIVASGANAITALLKSRLMPFYEHRRQFRAWFADALSGGGASPAIPELEGMAWGDMARADLAPAERAATIERNVRRVRHQLHDYAIAGKTPVALEQVVARFRAHGAEVVLFEPPLHSSHRATYSDAVRQHYQPFIEELAASHGCRIAEFSTKLPDAMFRDNDHANLDGKAHASRLIVDEVLAPLWTELRANASATSARDPRSSRQP